MKQGTVKFFNTAKGFGFIKINNGAEEIFVHANDLNGLKIKEGDLVEFEVGQGKKGSIAINVSLL